MDIKEKSQIVDEQKHWYYKAKLQYILACIEGYRLNTVVDVGAGSGFFARMLLSKKEISEAWCIDINYSEDRDTHEDGKPVHYRKTLTQTGGDFFLLMDVLEHVDDESAFLADVYDTMKKNSLLLCTVPAFQFLWSYHDEFLGHKRRYVLKQLTHVIQSAGFSILEQTYFYASVFPLAVITRLLGKILHRDARHSQLHEHPRLVNMFLSALCTAELPLLPHNRLFGLTAACLARKI